MAYGTRIISGALALGIAGSMALGHGDVAPQAVDTAGLPELGDEWLIENPYRAEAAGEDVWARAVEIGASGYNQNCARCHGLEVVSGGLAPDLRFLEAEEYGDEWYAERFQTGYTQNGITKMPAFGDLLGQEAAWAIRTYIETRPDDAAMEQASDTLKGLRDQLASMADGAEGDSAAIQSQLSEIASSIDTLSGAPLADSVAFRAANLLQGKPMAYKEAAEILTIGLSAAH
ncbi:cytochrome c-550 PedF [Parasulfitobacter algicola]|uniref:Cytochrome c-550 PedF n=1 Tax=Parasulfitobacter algicola TaxID=2614809 RepID=A0ABX2IZT8_9RHOB|nr:cytochrome c-550 PedF [Sulfitobacter algicola]NSX56233.1 cytochrome c-550 PedF [Sulfitobacter algicola]